jgi:hypothetical protein
MGKFRCTIPFSLLKGIIAGFIPALGCGAAACRQRVGYAPERTVPSENVLMSLTPHPWYPRPAPDNRQTQLTAGLPDKNKKALPVGKASVMSDKNVLIILIVFVSFFYAFLASINFFFVHSQVWKSLSCKSLDVCIFAFVSSSFKLVN